MNAITLTGLSKTYPTFQLGPLDLTLPMGSIMGLVGENGAGKSTTLKLILDLLRPGDGEIAILDQPVPAEVAPGREMCYNAAIFKERTPQECEE